MVWVNSLALEKAGITKHTPDPEGGRIEREPDTGEPTGLLRGAEHLILEHIPPASLEKRKKTALAAQANLLSLGITGIRSMEKFESWEALDALDKEGKLKLRIYHLLPPDEVEEAFSRGIKSGQGTDRLWFGQVKLFADGSLGSDTALLHEPYLHQPENHGLAYLTREELQKNIEFAYSHSCDVAIHAIGDKGVTNALESIAAARQTYPGERRDSIEHVQLLRPQDFALFSEMGVTASIQPSFVATDWEMAMKKWGPERCQNAYTFKTFLQKGIPVQFSSDMPVELSSPIWGLQAAVTRQNSEGEPSGGWFPEQKLTLEESITGYTSQHAWVTRKEKDRGSLSPGKWADLTIFSQDLFKLEPKEWPSIEVEMTIIDGEIVYQKGR
jgi:predicted amidohydrolase YtcJ